MTGARLEIIPPRPRATAVAPRRSRTLPCAGALPSATIPRCASTLFQRYRASLARPDGEEKGQSKEARRRRGERSRRDPGGIFSGLSRSGLPSLFDGAQTRAPRAGLRTSNRAVGCAFAPLTSDLAQRGISGTRGLRYLRHPLRTAIPTRAALLMWDEFTDFRCGKITASRTTTNTSQRRTTTSWKKRSSITRRGGAGWRREYHFGKVSSHR